MISERPSGGSIDLVRVVAHEMGHALGLPHGPSGNLMQPTVDARIRRPKSWDIAEIQRRYGKKPDWPGGDNGGDNDGDTGRPSGGTCADLLGRILKDAMGSNDGRRLARQALVMLVRLLRSGAF